MLVVTIGILMAVGLGILFSFVARSSIPLIEVMHFYVHIGDVAHFLFILFCFVFCLGCLGSQRGGHGDSAR